MSSDSYWFTRGGLEHRHEMHRADRERNKELGRIADALERVCTLMEKLYALEAAKAQARDQPNGVPGADLSEKQG